MSENDDTLVEGSELSDHQVKELTRQLAEAESAIEALMAGQVDAMLDTATVTPVLLQQFQEALRVSEARYHRLVSRMAALIFELAPDGTTFFVNEAAIKMFGYQPDELQGHNWWNMLLSAEQRQQLTDLYGQFQTGDVTNYELVLTARDGSLVTLALNSANYYQTDGTLQRVVGFGLDITERKQIEAELIEVQRRLLDSRETERLQLAQELHDGPVQNLYGVAFQLSVLKEALSTELDQAKLTVTQQLIQQVIQTLRTTFTELRPPTLAPFGLEKAIRSHAEGFQVTYPALKIKLDLMPDGRTLPERVRLALFRIYQAALNNVVRHANAQQVVIRLKLDAEDVVLEVQDNGQGFAVPKRWIKLARQGHLGLVGMVDRAEAIRGQLEIVSAPEAGTLVRIIAPQAGDESSSSF